jgi:uncharacterized OsmC-like protein
MTIQEAVVAASRYLTDHPNEARYRDSPARARVIDGLIVEVEGPDGAQLRTDMPRAIGGTESAPSPGWLFRASIAACVASLVLIRAAALGVTLTSVEVDVDSESDDRGILGLDASIPAGPLSSKIVISLGSDGGRNSELDALARWAVEHCPSSEALGRKIPVEVELRLA